jgi:mediator of RNA polymerase II transcription subunit 14
MPGIVMDDAHDSGSRRWTSSHSLHDSDGESNSVRQTANNDALVDSGKASGYLNGSSNDPGPPHRRSNIMSDHRRQITRGEASSQKPPELLHISQGFFPYGQLINRAVQQCWNDISDLITELADIHVSAQQQTSQLTLTNGKSSGNQSTENVQKKLRLLEFAQSKRAEFIKLLVLSQWSRQAADVSKLIDLQGFIRTRHLAYNAAMQRVADMKRDLVRAQVANPDLATALEVLSTGKVSSMPDVSSPFPRHMHEYMLIPLF